MSRSADRPDPQLVDDLARHVANTCEADIEVLLSEYQWTARVRLPVVEAIAAAVRKVLDEVGRTSVTTYASSPGDFQEERVFSRPHRPYRLTDDEWDVDTDPAEEAGLPASGGSAES